MPLTKGFTQRSNNQPEEIIKFLNKSFTNHPIDKSFKIKSSSCLGFGVLFVTGQVWTHLKCELAVWKLIMLLNTPWKNPFPPNRMVAHLSSIFFCVFFPPGKWPTLIDLLQIKLLKLLDTPLSRSSHSQNKSKDIVSGMALLYRLWEFNLGQTLWIT
jgi:hypothetical protein